MTAPLTSFDRTMTLVALGAPAVLLSGHQLVGNTTADEQLERFYEAYRRSLAHLYQ